MSWWLLLALGAVTLASRVLPMALLPVPRGRAAELLDALPAPLFAALAALSLVGAGTPEVPAVAAVGGALVGAARRSLLLALGCGATAYLLARAGVG